MNFWVLSFSSCSNAGPYLVHVGRGAPLLVCHTMECIPEGLLSPELLVLRCVLGAFLAVGVLVS